MRRDSRILRERGVELGGIFVLGFMFFVFFVRGIFEYVFFFSYKCVLFLFREIRVCKVFIRKVRGFYWE